LSFNTSPLTVLLTPPNNSPTGRAGIENVAGAADLLGTSVDKILCIVVEIAGAAAGAGAGGNGAGGSALYFDECLRLILRTPFKVKC
jgi:hypothetical protein